MIRFLFVFAVLLSFAYPVSFATAANTKLTDEKAEHARSAFLFATRKDWNNALLHAKQTSDPAFQKLITWEYALDADSGASFDEITQFIDDNPHWPDQKKLRIRAEMALRKNDVPDHDIIAWFGDETPITGMGKIALAEALARSKMANKEKINTLVREGWRGGDFDEPEEKKILETHGDILRSEDHVARIDRLLWEERVGPAKRILSHVSGNYQKLFKARIALIDDKRLAVLSVLLVPSSLKNDPGLIYDRMCYRARRDDNSGTRDMLLMAPAHPPYPEKWWKHREVQVRKAIDEKKYSLAAKLLANHGQVEGAELADALWLQAWLQLEFLNQPTDAYNAFYAMYNKVRYSVSKARAAYWAGRAAEKAGDKEASAGWYASAAAYPTTFYGQLAALKQNGTAPLRIPASPSISSEDKRRFENDDVIAAIRRCLELGQPDIAHSLIARVVENTDDMAQIALTSQLGVESGYIYLSVHAAKKAFQQNVVLLEAGYPAPKTPASAPIERALTLAISRQESEFDPHARSPSGAVGLMQLLTGTAKEVARKHGMGFSASRLLEPDYNMTLGSLYLGRLVSSYDGSYIMAIAAYNAGPGNIRNWAQQFATPGNDVDNAVNWIEKIPFSETRNYVQRVMENLQVYRHIEADGGPAKLKLGEDLVR